MATTYIDIDSTYRDRKIHPNPADFTINFSERIVDETIENARNIISNGYPYKQWQWGCTGIGTDGRGLNYINSTIDGFNSEDNVSAYIGLEHKGFELGLVTGYSDPLVPMIRYKKNNWFIAPGYEVDGTYGIVIGWEFKLK